MERNLLTYLLVFILFVLLPFQVNSQIIGKEVNPLSFGIDPNEEDSRPEVIRKRYVSLKSWTTGPELELSLFPDVNIHATLDHMEEHVGIQSWVGRLADNPGSYVILTQKDGIYFGKIVDANFRSFQIMYKSNGIYTILETDGDNIPKLANDGEIPQMDQEGDGDPPTAADGICEAAFVCGATTIDLMILYTQAAKTGMGGTASSEAAIVAAVTEMNTVNTNSGVIHNYQLVHTEEVNFVETGNSSADLSALRSQSDGKIDYIHQLRYDHQADLVSMITGQYCGIGYVQSNTTFFGASSGFNLAGYGCMMTNLTLAHECGHNMGLHHDWYVNSAMTPCPHNHGFVNDEAFVAGATSNQQWRTVMAYNNECSIAGFSCTRLPYWSNPNNTHNGDAMGIANHLTDPANSAFSLAGASCLVSAMSDQLTSFPVEYLDFKVHAERNGATLSWSTSREINNEGFDIEIRSGTDSSFRKLGFVSGYGNTDEIQTYGFHVPELLPGEHIFRLKQIDIDGKQTYSDLVQLELASDDRLYYRLFPNPVTSISTLEISIPAQAEYSIEVINAEGKMVQIIHQGSLEAGLHNFSFDKKQLSPGLYVFLIKGLGVVQTGKMWIKS